jgi:hypothetical protein
MFAESVSVLVGFSLHVVSLLLAEHLSLVDIPCLEVDIVGADLDMVEGFGNTLLVVLDV